MKKIRHFSSDDIANMDRFERVQLINSIKGFSAANLIGTKDKNGRSNLAIFNSVVHLGSSPALLGFVMRPHTVERHTYENILESNYYTINHVHSGITERAHYTSANFEKDISEFDKCGLTEQYIHEFNAPYVQESQVKVGMRLEEVIDININGTKLVIGTIHHIYAPEDCLASDGSISLESAGTAVISGLDSYYRARLIAKYPYAKTAEVPAFQKVEKRPDQVVYDDESRSYNASLLPYATDQGAPSIVPTDLTLWKKSGASKISHLLKARYDEIRSQFEDMKALYSWNEMVYQAKFSFEPVLGEVYHLYKDSKGGLFLSMIPPGTWKKEHLGSFRLNADQIWERIDLK